MGWENVTLGQMLLPFAGVGVLAMGIGSYLKWIAPVWRQVRQFLDDWNGRAARPGFDAEPGFPERMRVVEQGLSEIRSHVAEVRYNVKANGGYLSHDEVMRRFQHVDDRITEVESRIPCPPPGEAAGVTPPPDAP